MTCHNDLLWYSRIWTWQMKFRPITTAAREKFPIELNSWRGGEGGKDGWADGQVGNCSLHCSHGEVKQSHDTCHTGPITAPLSTQFFFRLGWWSFSLSLRHPTSAKANRQKTFYPRNPSPLGGARALLSPQYSRVFLTERPRPPLGVDLARRARPRPGPVRCCLPVVPARPAHHSDSTAAPAAHAGGKNPSYKHPFCFHLGIVRGGKRILFTEAPRLIELRF